ncbi:hypothetical protein [Gilvibacter sediminis]|uniref:hypothetical protein n=1 Tax=Gilvibacter sediminis TaxID=379071 RepID=UPI002350DE86|nr:hypothetical protein [Gilvibacter sediminis]MDC7996604.1 hypothetical protein [Gilvibacter sediminis]
MDHPIQTIHQLAQYLAAAAISFMEAAPDDSHTNLGFDDSSQSLSTHPLNDLGVQLCFSYADFSLFWKGEGLKSSISLDGKTHQEVLNWLKSTAEGLGFDKPYQYEFHYDLPYQVEADQVWVSPEANTLNQLSEDRANAQLASEAFATELGQEVAIRIWPHHFDTGGYSPLENDLGVGWGLAIPDSVVNSSYYYISYYKDGNSYLPDDLPGLTLGDWHRDGFTGGVLPLKESDQDGFAFFKQVHQRIMSH